MLLTLSTTPSVETGYLNESVRLAAEDAAGRHYEIEIVVSGWVLAPLDVEAVSALSSNRSIEWFTGGDASWEISRNAVLRAGALLKSGPVQFPQESTLVAYMRGPTYLGFVQGIVGNNSGDQLEVIIQQERGVVGFETYHGDSRLNFSDFELLDDVEYQVIWRFTRSSAEENTQIAAYLDDVEISDQPVLPPPGMRESSGSSGGSGEGLFIVMLTLLMRRVLHRL